jgi:hypothetical protein
VACAILTLLSAASALQGNRFFGMHWFYRPEDTCLLVDKNMVKAKAKELAKADLAAWTKEKACCKAEKVPLPFSSLSSDTLKTLCK